MCSIIGYKGIFNQILVENILRFSRIRGLHSFGYSYLLNDDIVTKKYLNYNVFKDSLFSVKPDKFIAHFRYSTSGDYKIVENNQPLTEENISIAFNGVISQKSKEEMENEYQIKLKADNDGYILMNKFNDQEFIRKSNISYAMVALVGKELICMRNKNRPMHIYKDESVVVISSTKDILNRSGLMNTQEVQPFVKLIF